MSGSNINSVASGGEQQQQHQSSTSGSTTIVKYEKSSCLFCNEWFDSQTFTVSKETYLFGQQVLIGIK